MKKYLAFFTALAFAAACNAPKQAASSNEADLYKTWRLVEVQGQAVDTTKLQRPAEFTFDKTEQRISGSAGCNNIFGKFTVAADKLTFSPLAATKMACQDMSVESKFLSITDKVNNWKVTEGFLVLSQDGTALAKFIAK
ncbi:META domain-containing protein [Chitinophaga lutea]|nr:META domain-containing protein [Chitinophaga lutea]